MIDVPRSTIPKPGKRDEWLAARRPFFNASAAACLYDRHPFQTAADYATEKLTGREQPDNAAMRRGRMLEGSVAEWFAYEVGARLAEPDVMFAAGRVLATVDRITISGAEHPVEIKTSNKYLADPEPYWIDQCQAIMLCTGHDTLDLVWLSGSLELHYEEVDADERHQADMLERAERFMAAIDMGIVPDWIVPELTATHITALYPDPAGELELDAETAELIDEYRAMKLEVKAYEAAMTDIKNRVAGRLGEHAVGTRDGVPIVTFKAIKDSVGVDVNALRADYPDLVEKYEVVKPGGRRFLPVGS